MWTKRSSPIAGIVIGPFAPLEWLIVPPLLLAVCTQSQRADPWTTRVGVIPYAGDLECNNLRTWEASMVKIAILDDWQDVARKSADWSRLAARAELTFFADAFGSEDEAAAALADFEILLTMRERTAFPATLIRRLPKLRMISITGASVATLDLAACARQGVVVCNTAGGGHAAPYATAELALGLLIAAARSIPAADATIRAGGFQRGLPVGVSLAGK